MAKSYTEKKSSFLTAQKTFTDFSVKYINEWTKEELKKYRNEPVVIPQGNYGFLVGSLKITGLNENCWQVEQLDGRYIHSFTSKATAILFCMYMMKNKHSNANEILVLDSKIGNLEQDIQTYDYQMRRTKDTFKYGNLLNRSINAKVQRRSLVKLLQKTLISAKYLNFGK